MKQLNFHVHCHSRGSPVSIMTLSLLLCWKQCNILTLYIKEKTIFQQFISTQLVQTIQQLIFHVRCHSRGSPVSLITLSLLLCWKQCNILALLYKRKNYFPGVYINIVSTNHTVVEFSLRCHTGGNPVLLIILSLLLETMRYLTLLYKRKIYFQAIYINIVDLISYKNQFQKTAKEQLHSALLQSHEQNLLIVYIDKKLQYSFTGLSYGHASIVS